MSNWSNYDDVLAQLVGAGLLIDSLEVGTSSPKRCKIAGEDKEKRGWYWLNDIMLDDGKGGRAAWIVGAYGVYHGNDNGKQSVKLHRDKNAPSISDDQRAAIAARQKENQARMKAARRAEVERAALLAGSAWRKYIPDGESTYLAKKGVGAHGLRFAPAGNGTVAVPMTDAAGKVWGLQIIRGKDRGNKLEKQYWPKGLQKQGHYHLIGGTPRGLVLIAEGYATAASLHEATQIPTVVAFDAGNLLPVTQAIKKTYPKAKILICADDDYLTPGNPGVLAAQAAAHSVSGSAHLVPVFAAERPAEKKGATDFNDLQALEGRHTVRAQVESALRSLGWNVETPVTRREPRAEGEGDGSRRRALSIMALDELVNRFIPLDDGTGKYVFDLWTKKIASREQMVTLLPAGVRGDDIKRHPTWIERGAYYMDQVGFDPAGDDSEVELNTWKGWPMTPKAGRCDLLLELLHYLCSAEKNGEEVYRWLLCWMAYPLQHPGAKMSSAVIMHGPQGTGKSTVFQALAKIYGDYATVLNQRGLEDKFNSDWVESKLFVLAEEVVTRAEMWHIKNELKELVTGDWIRINPKNIAAYRQRNHLNIIYLSNENQPLPLENDDRRHLVVYTPPMLDDDFYDQVFQELDNGGVQAFYHHLLKLDLSGFHPKKRPPFTESKRSLIALSSPSEIRFIHELLDGDLAMPVCPVLSTDFYDAYLKWCRKNGEMKPRASNIFHGAVSRQPGWQKKRVRIFENLYFSGQSRPAVVVIPPEKNMQAAGHGRQDGKPESEWVTEGVFAWRAGLDEGGEFSRSAA